MQQCTSTLTCYPSEILNIPLHSLTRMKAHRLACVHRPHCPARSPAATHDHGDCEADPDFIVRRTARPDTLVRSYAVIPCICVCSSLTFDCCVRRRRNTAMLANHSALRHATADELDVPDVAAFMCPAHIARRRQRQRQVRPTCGCHAVPAPVRDRSMCNTLHCWCWIATAVSEPIVELLPVPCYEVQLQQADYQHHVLAHLPAALGA